MQVAWCVWCCDGGGGAAWRSSFIKSLGEVAPVVFQPVHQWGKMGRDSQRRTVAHSSSLYFTPLPCFSSDSSPSDCYYPPSSSPPSRHLPLYPPPLLHLTHTPSVLPLARFLFYISPGRQPLTLRCPSHAKNYYWHFNSVFFFPLAALCWCLIAGGHLHVNGPDKKSEAECARCRVLNTDSVPLNLWLVRWQRGSVRRVAALRDALLKYTKYKSIFMMNIRLELTSVEDQQYLKQIIQLKFRSVTIINEIIETQLIGNYLDKKIIFSFKQLWPLKCQNSLLFFSHFLQ